MFQFEEKVLPCFWVPSSFVLHSKADLPSLRFTVCSSVGAWIPSVLFPRSTHHQFITQMPSNVAESQLSVQLPLLSRCALVGTSSFLLALISVGSGPEGAVLGTGDWSGRSSGKFSCQKRVVDVLLHTAKGSCYLAPSENRSMYDPSKQFWSLVGYF